MAGWRKGTDRIEKVGIRRGQRVAKEADGVLLVLDASRKETAEDISLVKKFQKQNTILLLNKIDLPQKIDLQTIKILAPQLPILEISALKRTQLKDLEKTIVDRFIPDQKRNEYVILHLRQKLLLQHVQDGLNEAQKLIKKGYSEEVFAEEVRRSFSALSELVGDIQADDILTEVFSRFCVGK
jgi:tRNA modification GTPase